MKPKTWYKIRGFLADGNASSPTPTFSFVVEQIETTPPAALRLSDFIDREVDFEGRAAVGRSLARGRRNGCD